MEFSRTRTARSERKAHFAPRDEILSEKIFVWPALLDRVCIHLMSAPDSPAPEAPRRPLCTIAAWVVPALGALITYMVYQDAVAHRSGGDWLPGIGALIVGSILTSCITIGVSIAAFLRRERNAWLALLPMLAGLCVVLSFGWNYVRNTMGMP